MIELRRLIELEQTRAMPRVSILLPGGDQRERLVKLTIRAARKATQVLRERFPGTDASELLAPVDSLTQNPAFWEEPLGGVALFANAERAHGIRLLWGPDPRVAVDEWFHFGPLLPQLMSDAFCWILVLGHRRARLLQSAATRWWELGAGDLSASLAESMGLLHRAGPATAAPSAVANPLNVGALAGGVDRLLERFPYPMVLAGPRASRRAFLERSHSRGVLELDEEVVAGATSLSALRQRAWERVEARFAEGRQEAVARVGRALGTGLSDREIPYVLPEARIGRVDTVILADPHHLLPPAGNRPLSIGRPSTRERLTRIVMHTRLSGGEAYLAAPSDVPGGGFLAARYRYLDSADVRESSRLTV